LIILKLKFAKIYEDIIKTKPLTSKVKIFNTNLLLEGIRKRIKRLITKTKNIIDKTILK